MDSNVERGARVCMNDKLLNWTFLLWIREYPRWYIYYGCFGFCLVLGLSSAGQPPHSRVCCLQVHPVLVFGWSQGRPHMRDGRSLAFLFYCRVNSLLNHHVSIFPMWLEHKLTMALTQNTSSCYRVHVTPASRKLRGNVEKNPHETSKACLGITYLDFNVVVLLFGGHWSFLGHWQVRHLFWSLPSFGAGIAWTKK